MKKIINICGKDYTMQSSAYTQFAYKDETGRSFIKDLQKIIDNSSNNDIDTSIDKLDEITELLLKISYIMIQEGDKNQVNGYVEFVKSLDSLFDDAGWITEVIELACNPLSGRLQKIK